uniref:Uncharacterized protein n=1 Tax=Arundo donax TaxID=35708 RepID=A0A0A9PYV5_ARUDO
MKLACSENKKETNYRQRVQNKTNSLQTLSITKTIQK